MGRRQAVRHSTLTAAFTGSNPVGLVGENMLEKPILSNLRNNQCQFYIGSPKGIEFYCYPKYLTGDTIKRCTPCEHPYTKKERQNLIQRSLHFHFLKSHDAITYMYK